MQGAKMKLTIEEYSKRFKMSSEMIHSKIRAKKLNYILDNGTTYIVIPEEKQEKEGASGNSMQTEQKEPKPKITVATLIELYKRENRFLKNRIKELETKIDKLIEDKERILREERERVEKLYAAKDEQLKNILELINAKLQLEKQIPQTPLKIEAIPKTNRIELKEYLKTLDLDPTERKIIKKRFQSVKGSDIRVQEQNGKIYIDFGKYDYSDLLHI